MVFKREQRKNPNFHSIPVVKCMKNVPLGVKSFTQFIDTLPQFSALHFPLCLCVCALTSESYMHIYFRFFVIVLHCAFYIQTYVHTYILVHKYQFIFVYNCFCASYCRLTTSALDCFQYQNKYTLYFMHTYINTQK